jgi:hypothetical protein
LDLFKAIDAAKTGEATHIANHLKKPKKENIKMPEVRKVWQRMADIAEDFKMKWEKKHFSDKRYDYFTKEHLLNILKTRKFGASDFELFTFIVNWCNKSVGEEKQSILAFTDYIDFGTFQLHQLDIAYKSEVPYNIIYNALNKSHLLRKEHLTEFNLQVCIDLCYECC